MGITEALKLNCSTIFLLPGIGLHRQNLLKHGFIAAFTDDISHEPHYKDSVYLLYQPPDIDLFQIFLDHEYQRTKLLIEDYDYAKGYVVTVYKFPEEYMQEYRAFSKGKYSKFRKKYTELFPETSEIDDDEGGVVRTFSLHYLIFTRQPAIREFWEEKIGEKLEEDAECWTAPGKGDVLDIRNFYNK